MQQLHSQQWYYFLQIPAIILMILVVAGCSSNSKRTAAPLKATSRPYTIKGIRYQPQHHYEYEESGLASYYGVRDGFHGKKTATGETFNAHDLTAAHKTLPIPSVVRVTNLDNGRALMLKVNDRGPFHDGRIIDVSQKAAKMLGFYMKGTANVKVECIVEESLALQGKPLDHMPTMIAQANIPEAGEIPPAKHRAIDQSRLPVQMMLAQASPGPTGREVPTPKKRPGWTAVKELLTPAEKGMAYASAKYNEKPSTSIATAARPSGIFIQAGTFSKYNNAHRLTQKLKPLTKGVPVRLNTVAVNKTPMFTVRLGPVQNSVEAEQLIKRMSQAGYYDAKIIHE